MRIACIEIQNFRKLNSVRIDFSKTTTILVGANNSGKTSAMTALKAFMPYAFQDRTPPFCVYDIPLDHHTRINNIGKGWLAAK